MIETKRTVMAIAKEIVEERYGYRISSNNKSRKPDIAEARGMFVSTLRELFGFQYTDIADYLGMTRQAMVYADDRVNEKSKKCPITKREMRAISTLTERKVKELLDGKTLNL
jgi:chromosomal replication initiation ATPase DnaA